MNLIIKKLQIVTRISILLRQKRKREFIPIICPYFAAKPALSVHIEFKRQDLIFHDSQYILQSFIFFIHIEMTMLSRKTNNELNKTIFHILRKVFFLIYI